MLKTTQTLNDPLLPQLASAVDCQAMATRFQQLLVPAEGGMRVVDCQIGRMKYKPGKSLLVVYQLTLSDSAALGAPYSQLVCARFYPRGESARRFAKAKQAPLVPTGWGEPLCHLPDLEMVTWLFPNDPKLTGLPRLMDVAHLRNEMLPPIVDSLFADTPADALQITQMSHSLVHYAPEHTCTVRVQMEVQDIQRETTIPLVLYGKTYYNDDGAETNRLMTALWNDPAHHSGRLLLAQPVGYDPQQRILWQRGLNGKPLLAFESQPSLFVDRLRQAAQSVATLHQCNQPCRRSATLDQWLAKLHEMRVLLSEIRPARQQQIASLIDYLLANKCIAEDAPSALLHGDLHLQNFLVDEGRIALIDMDNLCIGSPWQDVGSFVAGLFYRGLLTYRSYAATETLAASFCDAYAERCHYAYSPHAVRWYIASALINERAYRTVSRWKGGNLDFIDDLLNCAAQVLGLFQKIKCPGSVEKANAIPSKSL